MPIAHIWSIIFPRKAHTFLSFFDPSGNPHVYDGLWSTRSFRKVLTPCQGSFSLMVAMSSDPRICGSVAICPCLRAFSGVAWLSFLVDLQKFWGFKKFLLGSMTLDFLYLSVYHLSIYLFFWIMYSFVLIITFSRRVWGVGGSVRPPSHIFGHFLLSTGVDGPFLGTLFQTRAGKARSISCLKDNIAADFLSNQSIEYHISIPQLPICWCWNQSHPIPMFDTARSAGQVLLWCSRWRSNREVAGGRRPWRKNAKFGRFFWFGKTESPKIPHLHVMRNHLFWGVWNMDFRSFGHLNRSVRGDWSNQNEDLNRKWRFGLGFIYVV